jgi:hypothetical protein
VKGIVDIRIVDDQGNHHILVSQQTRLTEESNARIAETLHHLGKIERGREIALNIQAFLADGTPAPSDAIAARWTVSYLIRVPDGFRGSVPLLSFRDRGSAERFANNLYDAFSAGRIVRIENASPSEQEIVRQQGASASVMHITASKPAWGTPGV